MIRLQARRMSVIVVLVVAVVVAVVLGVAPPAGAQVSGPCTATIAGKDVSTATTLTGRSPLTTAAGVFGLAVGGLGLAASVGAALRAKRSFARLLRSILAGVPLGLGLAVLAQQMGAIPLTGATIAAWVGAGAALSGLANLGVAALRTGTEVAAPA
jgi:hypothetical protein